MQKQSKDRLGRGLTSLLGANYNKLDDFIVPAGEDNKSEYIFQLNIQNIVKNNENPRNKFDEIEIENLKNSIIEHGVLQPIIVRPYIDGKYMIIAGERRWRASKAANLETIPAIIKNINENPIVLSSPHFPTTASLRPLQSSPGSQQRIYWEVG